MKIIKNIIYIILLIITLIILIFNIFSALEKPFLGYRIFEVGSGSMEPTLSVNDLIIIKEEKDYFEKDIVTYRSGENYITHRIISINGDKIITQGDSNNTKDDPINKNDIVGKYVCKLRINGFVVYLFSVSKFWILVFLIGILITALLPDRYKLKKKKTDRD